jgi:uncharacterized protein (TIGR00255 family)
MIYSMTGFGNAQTNYLGTTISVEIRSVNHRFSEITARLPRLISSFEQQIRDIVKNQVERGKINISVSFSRNEETGVKSQINETLALSYYKMLENLNKKLGIDEKIKIEHILSFPDVIVMPETSDEEQQNLVNEVCKVVEEATKRFKRMRFEEGEQLAKDLISRIKLLNSNLDKIEKIAKNMSRETYEILLARVSNLVKDTSVLSQERLELEVALLADKSDVTEEITRFRSHNKMFLETLENSTSPGRRINFILQEMFREANTIGSKSIKSEIAHLVVNLK